MSSEEQLYPAESTVAEHRPHPDFVGHTAATMGEGLRVCPMCKDSHGPMERCERLRQVALSLNLFAVPAFLTDPLNRFVWVNNEFARIVGDPVSDHVPSDLRFIPASIVGPYRDAFPRGRVEVAQCLQSLHLEVTAGRLARGSLALLRNTYSLDAELLHAARKTDREWDGTVVVKQNDGKMSMVREEVVPVADAQGGVSGFNISLWQPVEQDIPALVDSLDDRPGVASILTVRQLEIAQLYTAGLTSKDVASKAGVTSGTARAHLEEIYSRLDIHSRAELAALLVREGLG
ncbi:MAG: LuxR C-terminal-related transcriptional regulator [SAR202 cluster bacterium]|nr:LuxR C-terminal-related transcriptional regulator [SAR202 cluster bacterium]MDP6513620.1 LuxR C-terminal-related transcriptional regulator [SAR202 cluster bacterium]MDP6716492.1 LuxR C-terminal-related transcriptional regulator [SAR202 cluster bacterium]